MLAGHQETKPPHSLKAFTYRGCHYIYKLQCKHACPHDNRKKKTMKKAILALPVLFFLFSAVALYAEAQTGPQLTFDTDEWMPGLYAHHFPRYMIGAFSGSLGNQPRVRMQKRTSINMIGTSIKTPTTVASAAPEPVPYKVRATAMATSK